MGYTHTHTYTHTIDTAKRSGNKTTSAKMAFATNSTVPLPLFSTFQIGLQIRLDLVRVARLSTISHFFFCSGIRLGYSFAWAHSFASAVHVSGATLVTLESHPYPISFQFGCICLAANQKHSCGCGKLGSIELHVIRLNFQIYNPQATTGDVSFIFQSMQRFFLGVCG